MQVYIEDRNGKKYFVEKLSRKAKIKLYSLSQKVEENEEKHWYGAKFEPVLYKLIQALN